MATSKSKIVMSSGRPNIAEKRPKQTVEATSLAQKHPVVREKERANHYEDGGRREERYSRRNRRKTIKAQEMMDRSGSSD